jgi:uncharacterized OsmC-like protein
VIGRRTASFAPASLALLAAAACGTQSVDRYGEQMDWAVSPEAANARQQQACVLQQLR